MISDVDDLKTLHEAIEHLSNLREVSLSLYRINKTGPIVKASTFALSFANQTLKTYLEDVVLTNIESLDEYEDVAEYNGDYHQYKLQWISTESPVVESVLTAVKDAKKCAEEDWISDLNKACKDPKGTLLKYSYEGNEVELYFDAAPIKRFKTPLFSLVVNKFNIVEGPFLVLPLKIDFMRVSNRLYFFSKRGLNTCISPEADVRKAKSCVASMIETNAITNPALLTEIANSGHNPRRLMKFDKTRFDRLSNDQDGKIIRERFGLGWSDGKLVVDSEAAAERLIKMVCKRGMIDPFTEGAMEVSGAETWK